MTMLEQAARAVCVSQRRNPDEPIKGLGSGILAVGDPTPLWRYAVPLVQAVLEELKKPNGPMLDAGRSLTRAAGTDSGSWHDLHGDPESVWEAMLLATTCEAP